jgi:hypothetical protein
MSDPSNLVPLKEVPQLVPGCPHLQTVRRWIRSGVRGRLLPASMRGGRIYVDPAEVATFVSIPVRQPQEVCGVS